MSTKLNLAITPDVTPVQLPNWYVLCKTLQKKLDITVNATEYYTFDELKKAADEKKIDLIFANPFISVELIQNHQFLPLAKPGHFDEEMVIVCKKDRYESLYDLPKTPKISASENEDIRQLGLILLEPASILSTDCSFISTNNNLLTIKKLMNNEADIAFLPKPTFENLSRVVKDDLTLLVNNLSDDVDALTFLFLLSPQHANLEKEIRDKLSAMNSDAIDQHLLKEMHIDSWELIENRADVEFLIDLVETLQI